MKPSIIGLMWYSGKYPQLNTCIGNQERMKSNGIGKLVTSGKKKIKPKKIGEIYTNKRRK